MNGSVEDVIKFNELCQLFESVYTLRARLKDEPIINFINYYRAKGQELNCAAANINTSFYPVLRLFLPQLERERPAYGIKETTFKKLYIRVLCLPKDSKDAVNLQNYRTDRSARNMRDFADTAYWILKNKCRDVCSRSIGDINRSLDVIANAHAEHKPREVDNELFRLVKNTSALEQKWLIRIILKDLKLGIGNDRFLNLFHPDAAEMYSVNGSLQVICEKLPDPTVRLHELNITLFTAFRPMLSLRCDTIQINKIVSDRKTFYVENKYDGERFQLHMRNGRFMYFSKNGYDYTEHFGSCYSSDGILTPYLTNCFNSNVENIILDGEMMGWNKITKSFGSKGMNYDVKNLKKDNIHRACFCVFDVLLHNNRIMSSKPLKERILLLECVVTPLTGVIEISKRNEIAGKEALLKALNDSVDKDEEGIVFKDPDSMYKPNDRKAGWWKMKLEYFEGVMSDLDVIIMGGYYGEGRRRNQISGFLMAIAAEPLIPGDKPNEFYSFAKIASGFNETEMTALLKMLGDNWKPRDAGDSFGHGLFWGREKPDVWIPPDKSCIIQVRGSELAHSTDFQTEYSLRFPRMQKIRDDKMWYECMTVTELKDLTSSSKAVEKLSKRHLELSDITPLAKKRQRRKYRQEIDTATIERKTDLLHRLEFCVLNGTSEISKKNIEILIKENGGETTQVEGNTTFCIIAGGDHPRLPSITKLDVVSVRWLLNVIQNSEVQSYGPTDMIYACPRTKRNFSTQFDKYGDSFSTIISVENCKHLIDSNKTCFEMDRIYLMPNEVVQFEEELQLKNNSSVFRQCFVYFDRSDDIYNCKSVTNRLLFDELDYRYYGGRVCKTLSSDTTHVVMDIGNRKNLQAIKTVLLQIGNERAAIVCNDFIASSIKNHEVQPTDPFTIKY